MKAAVFRGVNDVRCEEVPVPEIGPDEVLVRIHAVGLCQSDIKKFLHPIYEPPRIFGHEMAGEIEAVGMEVERWKPGDRVAVHHHIPCLKCSYCANESFSMCRTFKEVTTRAGFEPSGGGYAQYIAVPGHIVRHGIIPIPDEASFEEATFIEPVNCCLKAIQRAGIGAGERILVVGAGPVGLHFAQLLRHLDAVPIVSELMESRREKALELGAVAALDPREEGADGCLLDQTDGLGADAVILAVPSTSATDFAFKWVRKGGRILFFAEFAEEVSIALRPNFLYQNEVNLLGSYSSSYKLLNHAAELVLGRRIDVRPLMSTKLPLERISEAIELAVNPTDQTLKVTLQP